LQVDQQRSDRLLRQRAQQNVRRLIEHNRRETGLEGTDLRPQPVRSVGIVGAGLMGTAIAAVHVQRNLPVVITDTDHNALHGAAEKIVAELAGEMPHAEARDLVARLLHSSAEPSAVARCELVIESIVENVAAKHRLYAQLKGHLGKGAILGSNTSTIPIERLAAEVDDPARFCGYHFCHPVGRRPLVEIVRGPATSDQTIATMVAHAKATGRMPIVVGDGPGFVVNRLLLPYLGEGLELLLEGVPVAAVEHAAVQFGMANGPLRMSDEIGLDTALQGGWVLAAAFPDRVAANPLLVAMVKAGRLGRKSGAGFFRYDRPAADPPAEGQIDPPLQRLIDQWARTPVSHSAEMITDRLLLPVVLEATRILSQGEVRDPRDVDLAMIFGLGFPAWRGGLLFWADTLGAQRIVERLGPLWRLGARAEPTPMLTRLARTGGRFY